MKISIFDGGFANLNSDRVIEDWDEFCDLLSTPEVGPKNGRYYVRGHCDGPRCDENIRSLDLIVIDGDQLLSDGHSCCPPMPVHDLMVRENITHIIHSSYSNDVSNNRWKFRLIIPCEDLVDAECLSLGVAEIISMLHANGLPVRNVRENLAASQPWFTPRCPDYAIDDFYAAWYDGERYRLGYRTILESSGIRADSDTNGAESKGGQFSWDYVLKDFARGTIHMGLKSACGWLVKTTDWADVQIKDHLGAIVSAMCPDKKKVSRAMDGEIESLVAYCRKKSGVYIDQPTATWKDKCITAAELREKDFPPVRWAVDGIIPEGLTVLAGDPKVGKSLVAVDICSAIASGSNAFGGRSCVAGGAIYISMEDPERRVKDRITKQCDMWPETFRLVTGGIPTLGDGFFDVVDEMLMIYPDTRAIIVDTLQYIIPPKPPGVNDYDHYYRFLGPLHEWTLENHVAVVTITHKTKTQAISGDNVFSGIIGSVAIQGTADSMVMLCRNHAKDGINDPTIADGFLHIRGREVGNDCFALEFDEEDVRWSLATSDKTTAEAATGNKNWAMIELALRDIPMAPKDISAWTKLNYSTVKSCLRRMKGKGIVESAGDGKWKITGADYDSKACGW